MRFATIYCVFADLVLDGISDDVICQSATVSVFGISRLPFWENSTFSHTALVAVLIQLSTVMNTIHLFLLLASLPLTYAKEVVAYFIAWGTYDRKYTPDMIPASQLTYHPLLLTPSSDTEL